METGKDVKKILIVPDIAGWIVEDMAINIMRVLEDEFDFTLEYADPAAADLGKAVFSWKKNYNAYDVLYIMLPSYAVRPPGVSDKSDMITTFHGGPATEGQGDHIQRSGGRDMRMSYVSHQTNDRISTNTFTNIKKEKLKVTQIIDDNYLRNELLQLRPDETVHIINRPAAEKGFQQIQIKYQRRGFGFTNLYFTPHGVNIDDYKQDSILSDFVCGYAGWSRYLLFAQRDHRRGYWIMEAQKHLGFDLKIAAGIPKYEKGDIKTLKAGYPSNNIRVSSVEHEDMCNFYKGISCYLVPDKFAGGPMPVLEAGSMGIPVICTDAGLCGDIIVDGVHGRVVKDYGQFVNAIAWMRDHPIERKQMGKNLQEYIRKNRTWEAVAPYWSKFLKGVNDEES